MKNTIYLVLFGVLLLTASVWQSEKYRSETLSKELKEKTAEGLRKDSIIERLSDPAYQVNEINRVDSLREKAHKRKRK